LIVEVLTMDAHLNEVVRYLASQSWQIALLAAVVAVAAYALRHRSAHVRYLLWLMVLAKCLVPPLQMVPLQILPQTVPQVVPSLLAPPAWSGEHPDLLGPVTPISPGLQQSESAPPASVSPPRAHDHSASGWLGFAWITGAGVYLLINLLRALRGHYWLWKTRRPLPTDAEADTANLLRAYPVRRPPRIWIMEGVGQPFVWGLLRGSIYVPPSFLAIENPQHRRDILAHELSHIVRLDAAVNLLQVIAQAAFWFHPLVWWANCRIRREREKCCDEMAIAHLDARPKDYSSAIVTTLIQAQESAHAVPSLAVAGPVKNIEERIRAMLRPGKRFYRRPSTIAATVVLLVALLMVPTALVLTARAQTEVPKPQTQSLPPLDQAAAAGDLEKVNKLLAQGADLNGKDKDGWTPLHHAAWNGRRDVAAVLIAKGANVNATNATNRTALHLAAAFGDRFVPELLLAKGANINARDEAGDTPLHVAAGFWCVNEDLLELLIEKGADVNARNGTGQTPLHLAVMSAGRRKSENAVEFLLAHGADINARDKDGRTPLHVAAGNGTRKETVEFLLNKGADIKAKNVAGATALHLAAVNRHSSDIVELLLNRGADVNSVDSRGQTPLHYAVERGGDNETVERLIAKGADVNAKAANGETPAHLAAIRRNPRDKTVTLTLLLSKGADISSIQLAAYLGDLARVKGFLEDGVGVNAQDVYSVTPLHAAALGGQKEVAEFLLSKGALVNAEAAVPSVTTPLHCAALAGSREVAELLIQKGAEIDAKDVAGGTPLHAATNGRNTDTARLLIAHGADVNAKNEGGWTPLLLAAHYGVKDLVLLLLDHGADVNAQLAYGTMPSELAARQGHEDVVHLLIDKGADLSNRDVLLFCACKNQQRDLAELLIRKGANVNSKAWEDPPALQAIWYGYTLVTETPDIPKLIGILKLLLDNGADPHAKDRWDWSLLHYACGNVDLTKLLLDRGANPNVRTEGWGLTPLHLVAGKGNKAVTQLLLSRGADVNAKDFDGHTPLSYADDVGDNDIFGRPRETPLTAEDKAAKKETAEVLREHGAKE
jgi:ankyrin repeat protein/beta-lactamase regulating signal transducer with metallopeptidase domain